MERIGVGFAGILSPTEIVECVKLADDLGYDSAWMSEAHGGDQFSILTACAVATKRIRLGTSISSVFVRSAPTIAMAAACVDYYSNGRCILGLGSGHKVQVEPEHGLPFVNALPRLLETVDIVRALLRQGEVSYKGKVISIERFDLWFTPLRKEIPIYLAAVQPRMLQIAGEVGDGVLLAGGSVEQCREAVKHIAAGAAKAGKRLQDVDVGKAVSVIITRDKKQARDALRQSTAATIGVFPRYRRVMAEGGFHEEVEAVQTAWAEGDKARAARLVPDGLIDAMSVIGSAEECKERIQEYRKAGITLPKINVTQAYVAPKDLGTRAASLKELAFQAIRACAPS
ncbi:MAG: LLM class flavin-dependent oxidoreductase [Chloroflexi bacterium]|nr:LLM class flavin-dependent oxidoreductase [Chloroflexota bacterium]